MEDDWPIAQNIILGLFALAFIGFWIHYIRAAIRGANAPKSRFDRILKGSIIACLGLCFAIGLAFVLYYSYQTLINQ